MKQVKCRRRPRLIFFHLIKKSNTLEGDAINNITVLLFLKISCLWNLFTSGNTYDPFFTLALFDWMKANELAAWPAAIIGREDNCSSFDDKFSWFSEKIEMIEFDKKYN